MRAQEKSLADRLSPLVRAHKGKVAIALKHLDSFETFFLDADEAMPTASLIKFAILLELYQQAAENVQLCRSGRRLPRKEPTWSDGSEAS